MPVKKAPVTTNNKEAAAMRWISFAVVTGLFFTSGIVSIVKGKELDRTIGTIFVVITGFAWGANIWRYWLGRGK